MPRPLSTQYPSFSQLGLILTNNPHRMIRYKITFPVYDFMKSPSIQPNLPWPFKWVWISLAIYFCIYSPCIHVVFRELREFRQIADEVFFVITLSVLLVHNPNRFKTFMGERRLRIGDLAMGILAGILVILIVPIMDWGIRATGLNQKEFFLDSVNQALMERHPPRNLFRIFCETLFIPCLIQTFFTGFVFRSFLVRMKTLTAVYLGTLVFAVGQFDLDIGTLGLGAVSCGLWIKARHLVPALIFHISSVLAWMLFTQSYPRLAPLIIFLF